MDNYLMIDDKGTYSEILTSTTDHFAQEFAY